MVTVILGSLALAVASAAPARSRARPSARRCLVAWNAPANRANRLRLLAQKPITALQLLPGRVTTDTWEKGSGSTQTIMAACLLTLGKSGRTRLVTGRWRDLTVSHWSWGRWIPATIPSDANVRLLSDGRLGKLYHH